MPLTNEARAAVYAEAGRGMKKRSELAKKLAARKAKAQAADDAAAAAASEQAGAASAAASVAVDKIEAEEAAKQAPKPAPKEQRVKVGGKSVLHVTTDAEGLDAKESARIQAMCCAGKAGKVKAFHSMRDTTAAITDADVASDVVLVFSNCQRCSYTVDASVVCTKIFVERCTDFTLKVAGKVVTQTIEANRLERTNLLVSTRIGTLQVEQSKGVNVVYASKDCFHGYLVWAGCFLLRIQVGLPPQQAEQQQQQAGQEAGQEAAAEAGPGYDLMRCDFGLTASVDQTVNLERTQFKVWYSTQGKLVCDKIVRLKNGFPTTKREDAEFQRREEANMVGLADRMGITIHRKEGAPGRKVKPNAPCPCGSGKKYKKCCRA